MSLIIAEAPAPARPPIATPEEFAAFRLLHQKEVDDAIRLMTRNIHPGQRHVQVITPRRVDIMDQITVKDQLASPVREDFSGVGCKHTVLMRALFRDRCPEGVELSFDYNIFTTRLPTKDDPDLLHEETITELVAVFFIPGDRSRPLKKQR